MPGRYFLEIPLKSVAEGLGAALDCSDPGPRPDAAPGEQVAALIADPDRRLIEMRWSMVMSGRVNARGRPVMETIVNARSETLFDKSAFQGVRRAVLPVGGWYEWTGKKGSKTRWRMAPVAGGILNFAAIWDVWQGPGGVEVPQLATVTVAPNADVEAYHHRMPALLDAAGVATWLDGAEPEAAAVLAPAPAGTVTVTEARDVQAARGH
ncbi:MAG: SOS response-associated peptidase family protein [Pseudomonadota bacterium]